MSLYKWDERFSVNIEKMDVQHKQLFNMVNELHEAKKEGKAKEIVGDILNKLANYTVKHFKDEEILMQAHRYPGYENHKKEHEELIKKVQVLTEQQAKGGFIVTLEVSNFLKDWLVNHIMDTDKMYSTFLNERGVK